MMKEKTLGSWSEFTSELRDIYEDHKARKKPESYISNLLFRGQSDSSWKLETTLERASKDRIKLVDYYRQIKKLQPKLETLSGNTWETPSISEYSEWVSKLRPLTDDDFPAIPFLAYLRHHGFPSPLLDWSRSPFVSAFFAFRDTPKTATHVCIYAFLEWSNSEKEAVTGEPEICGIGQSYKTHKRHFSQQSEYTICISHSKNDAFYESHEKAFKKNTNEQDLLWKFNIPITERQNALIDLYRMNIGAFSLFGSEDSLLEELSTNIFYLGIEN